MSPAFIPLSLDRLQDRHALDPALLTAARLHVGAAGIEQMNALEHLIAAGQEHGNLVRALRQVIALLQEGEDTGAKQRFLQDGLSLLLLLDQLALAVTQALQQITDTPVQRISAERLDDIARQMNQHLAALETLVSQAEKDPGIPEDTTPGLEDILAGLREQLGRVARERQQGQVQLLTQLALQAATDLSELRQLPAGQRAAALEQIDLAVRGALDTLRAQRPS